MRGAIAKPHLDFEELRQLVLVCWSQWLRLQLRPALSRRRSHLTPPGFGPETQDVGKNANKTEAKGKHPKTQKRVTGSKQKLKKKMWSMYITNKSVQQQGSYKVSGGLSHQS